MKYGVLIIILVLISCVAIGQIPFDGPMPNKIDSSGLKQGFWKFGEPYPRINSMVICEGFYYNNKQIGVWKKNDRYGKLVEMEIYYDTMEVQADRILYNENNTVYAKGRISARPYNDSITVYDINEVPKSVFVTNVIRRHGHWTYYDSSGKVSKKGEYFNDKPEGTWWYYGANGTKRKEVFPMQPRK